MNNKLIGGLILLLVIANIATLSVFWLGRLNRPGPPRGGPKDYIIKELGFNTAQQQKYEQLVADHHQKAEQYQENIKAAKDAFFNLLQNTAVADTTKKNAVDAISKQTEQLDLLTFEHFQKVRMLCTDEQKKKFDAIIHQVLEMMGRPKPPGNGPPPQ
jgi:protein CpxP